MDRLTYRSISILHNLGWKNYFNKNDILYLPLLLPHLSKNETHRAKFDKICGDEWVHFPKLTTSSSLNIQQGIQIALHCVIMHKPASIRYKSPNKKVEKKWHPHMTALCKIHFMDNSPSNQSHISVLCNSIFPTWAVPEPVFSGYKEQFTACNCHAKENKVVHVRTYHVRVSTAQNANQGWMLLCAGLAHLVSKPGSTLNNTLTGHS